MSASIEGRNLFGSCEGMDNMGDLAIVGVLPLRGSGYCGCGCQHIVGGLDIVEECANPYGSIQHPCGSLCLLL